jgi:hypothetical protein
MRWAIEGAMSYAETFDLSKWSRASAREMRAAFHSISPEHAIIALILAGSIVRLAFSAATGLGTDESYTVANARTLASSYVDYPPLHVWLVGLWSSLWHSELPIVVRLPFIAIFAGSTWLMFRLGSLLFGVRAGLWSALLFNLAPVFTLAHASWVLPDGPLIFFMLSGATVVALLLFAEDAPSRAWTGWMLAGLFAGLAMLSKYHGAFLLAGVFVFLLAWKPGRRVLASPGPWLGAAVAILVFAPVILWNAGHDWVGLSFQAKRLASSHLNVLRIFDSIGAQAAYLSPWIFVPLAYVWLTSLIGGVASPRRFFLALLASGPIIGFTAANIISHGLPHWPMPGWLFMFPVLGAEAARFSEKRPRLVVGAAAAAAITLVAVIAALGTDARNGWLMSQFSVPSADPTADLMNWNEVVAATHWMEAGKLNYVIGKSVPVLCLCADPQQFRYLLDPARFSGQSIIVIGAHRDVREIDASLRNYFARVEPLAPIVLHRGGIAAIELTVVRGFGFRPNAVAGAAK